MKAIVQDTYGSADVLELRDIDKPAVGHDDVASTRLASIPVWACHDGPTVPDAHHAAIHQIYS